MSFVGSYTHSIDAKKRVFIPAKFRDELGEEFYITRKFVEKYAVPPKEYLMQKRIELAKKLLLEANTTVVHIDGHILHIVGVTV